ncbi:MAG: hypothetical protein HQK75_06410 [Candidatus Magnetomorum sp.]|nr:hypothetical protein [Candidatus Magnetomorum sp.]
MAKKKSTKSSSKKKSSAKVTRAEEKTKKTPPKKSKKPADTKMTAKKSENTPAKKKESAKKKTVTLRELLTRQFEKPEKSDVEPSPKAKSFDSIPDAPPFFDTKDSKKLKQLKSLLLQKIDLTDIPPPKSKPAKKAASTPKKTVSIAELIKKQFAVPAQNRWVAPSKTVFIPDAPPFIDVADAKERDRIRALLFQTIDLTQVPPPKPVQEERKPKPVPPKPKPLIPVSELIKRIFKPLTEQAVEPSPVIASVNIPDAPPLIDGSPDDIARIRELLFKRFDLNDVALSSQPSQALPETKESLPKNTTSEPTETEGVLSETKQENKYKEESVPIEEETSDMGNTETEMDQLEDNQSPAEESDDLQILRADDNKEDPIMSNSLKLVFAGILALFFMIYMASSANYKNYYLVDGKTGVELWQGDFSPMGKSHVITLMGMELPENLQSSYIQSEVNPLICSFFLDQANDILSDDNIPNLAQVKKYLEQAYEYADEKNQKEIEKRLNGIDFMMFILKADLAMQKGTSEDLEKAKAFIDEAQGLAEKNYQKDMIKKRLQFIENIPAQSKDAAKASKKAADNAEKPPESIAKPSSDH